jgi:hypothetical protein
MLRTVCLLAATALCLTALVCPHPAAGARPLDRIPVTVVFETNASLYDITGDGMPYVHGQGGVRAELHPESGDLLFDTRDTSNRTVSFDLSSPPPPEASGCEVVEPSQSIPDIHTGKVWMNINALLHMKPNDTKPTGVLIDTSIGSLRYGTRVDAFCSQQVWASLNESGNEWTIETRAPVVAVMTQPVKGRSRAVKYLSPWFRITVTR